MSGQQIGLIRNCVVWHFLKEEDLDTYTHIERERGGRREGEREKFTYIYCMTSHNQIPDLKDSKIKRERFAEQKSVHDSPTRAVCIFSLFLSEIKRYHTLNVNGLYMRSSRLLIPMVP